MFKTMKAADNGPAWWFGVTEGLAGAWGALEAGVVVEGRDDVHPVLLDLERRGCVVRLPDPAEAGALAAWLPYLRAHVRQVGPRDFEVPPEPPAPRYLDEPAVLRRFGWTAADLRQARATLAFPEPARRRTKFHEDRGEFEVLAVFYAEAEVDRWQRDRAAAARGLLSSVPS